MQSFLLQYAQVQYILGICVYIYICIYIYTYTHVYYVLGTIATYNNYIKITIILKIYIYVITDDDHDVDVTYSTERVDGVITSDEIDTDSDSVQEMIINDTEGIIKSIL